MLQEIAVKALSGRGRVNYLLEKDLFIENNVSKTLGCWIINLNYEIVEENNEVYLSGFFDIQLWYAFSNNQSSSVYEERINFKEKITMVYRNSKTLSNEKHYKVFVNKYPATVDMKLNDEHNISLKIASLFFVDVYQEMILVVETKENSKVDMTLEEELLLNVNPNYLLDKKE